MKSSTPSLAPRERFSSRVADYARHRPGYPPEVRRYLEQLLHLPSAATIADVGSGTGLSAVDWLNAGYTVYGVEPNAAMREAAESELARFPNFRSVAGSAEASTLPAVSVDLILCAQAFHWFDPPAAKAEFGRMIKKGGHIALIWNDRRKTGTAFLEGYERLLNQFGTDYCQVDHSRLTGTDFAAILGPHYQEAVFPNVQRFDRQGLLGRAFSSSYTPIEGTPERAALENGLSELFEQCQEAGVVKMKYDTRVYVSREVQ